MSEKIICNFLSSIPVHNHFIISVLQSQRQQGATARFASIHQSVRQKLFFMRRSYLQIGKPCITILAVLSKFPTCERSFEKLRREPSPSFCFKDVCTTLP